MVTVAIREATGWYKRHLTASLRGYQVPEIVLLTNDQMNSVKAKQAGITACSSIPICGDKVNCSGGVYQRSPRWGYAYGHDLVTHVD